MKIIVVQNKINRKYFPLIWVGLIAASFINALFVIMDDLGQSVGVKEIVVNALIEILYEGLLPAWLCYCSASIFSSLAIRRGLREVSHSDFIHYTMIFTAAARLVMGIVKICAIASYSVYVYATYICDVTVLSTALYVMFFVVLYPRFSNPVDGRNAFKLWSSAYLVCQGVHTLFPCVSNFLMKDNGALAERIQRIYENSGIDYDVMVTDDMYIASIIAVSVFVALLIATVVLCAVLDKKAKNFVPVLTEEPFDDTDGKVFDEFDI